MEEIVEIEKEEDIIDKAIEKEGEYIQEILIDKKRLKQIQKENFSLSNYSGFQVNLLERLGIKIRRNYLYYGLSMNERAMETSLTHNTVMIPLVTKKDIQEKLQKIRPEIKNTLGWIHIGAIQIIIKATFKHGLNTPIDLAIMDNRIKNREEACLGILRGNLKYGKLKFNIYPRISYHLSDKDFDKTLSLIQDFKRKDFFKRNNRPYSITYMISYAISNSHHSECFLNKDTIDFPRLFNDVSLVQLPSLPIIEEIEDIPLELDIQDNKPLITTDKRLPKLTFTSSGSVNSRRSINLPLTERNNDIKNYKVEGEYFNGTNFDNVTILIDTGANGNYISKKLCKSLTRYQLDNPHQYTNFNGEIHEINEVIETYIKFGEDKINIRLLIEDEGYNDTLEIMLGLTFLESVKPYQINSYGLRITYQDKMIYIPKK